MKCCEQERQTPFCPLCGECTFGEPISGLVHYLQNQHVRLRESRDPDESSQRKQLRSWYKALVGLMCKSSTVERTPKLRGCPDSWAPGDIGYIVTYGLDGPVLGRSRCMGPNDWLTQGGSRYESAGSAFSRTPDDAVKAFIREKTAVLASLGNEKSNSQWKEEISTLMSNLGGACALFGGSVEQVRGPLAIEMAFFEAHRTEWLEHHEGQFALIRGEHFEGTFDYVETAYRRAVEKWGNVPILIKEILPKDRVELHLGR